MKTKKLPVTEETEERFFEKIREEIEELAPDCMSEDVYQAREALASYLNATKSVLSKIGVTIHSH